jgi:tetratricopeptide (TPR) repeat protein
MVIDNADDAELFSQPGNLGQWVPEYAHGSVLVTTRNKAAGSGLTRVGYLIEVGKMNEGESKQLLQEKLKADDPDPDDLSRLASRLEHLPLALVQAAAFIQAMSVSVIEYLRLLEMSDQNLVYLLSEKFKTVGRDPETPHEVVETWILSFEQIQRQDTFAGELLSLMSLFDRQAIPRKFLSDYGERQQAQEPWGEMQLVKALGVLKAFSFVAEDKDQSFDIHRLVQLVTRKWLDRKERIHWFAEEALLVVSDNYPYGNHENRAVCSAYLPHAYAVLKCEGTGSRDERLARAALLHCAAGLFYYQGQWKEAEQFLLQATGVRKELLGEEHPDTLTSMANLASTYCNQGRWKEAEELGVQVMETRKRVSGEEHPDTLTSIANLASIYRNQGRWKEAEELQAKELSICSRVLGEEHPSTLTSIANLASTYWDQGRWKEAEELQVKELSICSKVLGEEHPSTLTSIANLASTYWNQGRWKEAEELGVQVMETRKRVSGEEHPDTLTSMANLASTYWNQGQWKEAEELEVQVLEVIKRVLGEEHPDTLTSMANLASTYWNQGRWKEAEELQAKELSIRSKVLGEEHPSTLTSIANLASTYWGQGRWKEAEELQVKELSICSKVLGEEHPSTLTSMGNLAFTWESQGRLDEALDLMRRCVESRKQILGPDHSLTMSNISTLHGWETASGRSHGQTASISE